MMYNHWINKEMPHNIVRKRNRFLVPFFLVDLVTPQLQLFIGRCILASFWVQQQQPNAATFMFNWVSNSRPDLKS